MVEAWADKSYKQGMSEDVDWRGVPQKKLPVSAPFGVTYKGIDSGSMLMAQVEVIATNNSLFGILFI